MKIKLLLLFIILIQLPSSCKVVKEQDKQYVNDPDMALNAKSAERYETNFQVYREGASGANGGKTGGGCGCN